MITNYFSQLSHDTLLQQPDTLGVVKHQSLRCAQAPSIAGLAYSGLTPIVTGLAAVSEENEAEESRAVCEVWQTDGLQQISKGAEAGIVWGQTEDVLWASKSILSDQFLSIEQATSAIYLALLTFIRDTGYQYPLRFWNYLPAINQGKGDNEVYKRFCQARFEVFERAQIATGDYPAASAIGHRLETGLIVTVIASKHAGTHHANARQVNAYQYPRAYGIKSPSFARATTWNVGTSSRFFVSGTASIIGHESMHPADLEGQLTVTEENIRFLLSAHSDVRATRIHSLCIYLKHQKHYAFVATWLSIKFPHISAVILQADICRSELLVEVECFCIVGTTSNN